jgi:hypothetical protein
MKILAKIYRALYGFVLMMRFTKRFDKSILVKKRIAIVGPASSAYNTNRGEFIDGFDYVVRINKAPHLVDTKKWAPDIGTRTDILFHSFFENEETGGGKLDLALYDRQGVKYIINPIAAYPGYRVTFNFYKKYLSKRTVYSLDKVWYRNLVARLDGFRPTIGICGLSAIMESDFSELYITGFTFYKTPFGAGYRDHMKDGDKALAVIRAAGLHDPEKEFEAFCNIYKKHSRKNIIADDTLKSILEQYI